MPLALFFVLPFFCCDTGEKMRAARRLAEGTDDVVSDVPPTHVSRRARISADVCVPPLAVGQKNSLHQYIHRRTPSSICLSSPQIRLSHSLSPHPNRTFSLPTYQPMSLIETELSFVQISLARFFKLPYDRQLQKNLLLLPFNYKSLALYCLLLSFF